MHIAHDEGSFNLGNILMSKCASHAVPYTFIDKHAVKKNYFTSNKSVLKKDRHVSAQLIQYSVYTILHAYMIVVRRSHCHVEVWHIDGERWWPAQGFTFWLMYWSTKSI